MSEAKALIDGLVANATQYVPQADEALEFVDMTPITFDELESSPTSPRAIVPEFLYADVRQRIAPGGVGKTTIALFEMMTLALGAKLWGYNVPKPVRTVLITKEDTRALLVGRMREIGRDCGFTQDEMRRVLENVIIVDVTVQNVRLTCMEHDVPRPHLDNITRLCADLEPFNPDWVIFDPAVSFGVGEARVNDAEQAIIEAMRIIVRRLDCCVEVVHHSGKANARDKAMDQYAGRGGSALADGSRMTAVMHTVDAQDWANQTGQALGDGETGVVIALPKLSYAKPQPDILVRRYRYSFEHVKALPAQSAEAMLEIHAERVYAFLKAEYDKGARHTKSGLDSFLKVIGLPRNDVRAGVERLLSSGRITTGGKKHSKTNHLIPVMSAGDVGEHASDEE